MRSLFLNSYEKNWSLIPNTPHRNKQREKRKKGRGGKRDNRKTHSAEEAANQHAEGRPAGPLFLSRRRGASRRHRGVARPRHEGRSRETAGEDLSLKGEEERFGKGEGEGLRRVGVPLSFARQKRRRALLFIQKEPSAPTRTGTKERESV